MRTTKLLTFTALTLWTVAAPAYGQRMYYTMTHLGTLRTVDGQGTSEAWAINNSGHIVGCALR